MTNANDSIHRAIAGESFTYSDGLTKGNYILDSLKYICYILIVGSETTVKYRRKDDRL